MQTGVIETGVLWQLRSSESWSYVMNKQLPIEDHPLTAITADIVAAYVANNSVPVLSLPELIGRVHAALHKAAGMAEPEPEPLVPAVPVKKSVSPEAIVCLEDGKRFKSLKRHLRTNHGLSPEEYRARWGLPHDYPMVAPNYSAARSAMAKDLGLGQIHTRPARAAAAPTPARRGRRPKAG